MTDEEIISEWIRPPMAITPTSLLDLIRRVREDEREACAKCADRYREAWRTTVKMDNSHVHHKDAAEQIAVMTRNRKDTQ